MSKIKTSIKEPYMIFTKEFDHIPGYNTFFIEHPDVFKLGDGVVYVNMERPIRRGNRIRIVFTFDGISAN